MARAWGYHPDEVMEMSPGRVHFLLRLKRAEEAAAALRMMQVMHVSRESLQRVVRDLEREARSADPEVPTRAMTPQETRTQLATMGLGTRF